MKQLLLATVAVLALAAPAHAAVIGTFGVNPTSAAGFFANDPNGPGVGGVFNDFYTFTLTAGAWIAVADATNTFADGAIPGPNYIQNFAGAIFETVGIPGGGDDILKFGPQLATLNPGGLSQSLDGTGFLDAGDYYLQIAGNAGITAGYGGNFSVTAVPEPEVLAMLLLGFGLLIARRKA